MKSFRLKDGIREKNSQMGVYITVDEDNCIITKQFPKYFSTQMIWPLNITYGVTQMKYRRVYTQPEVERKC